jgi:hypothetical protein
VPSPGLVTVTFKRPAAAMSEARMAALSCVALTKVVVRAFPLKLTVEPLTKFVPFTVNVNPGPPAIALVGEMLVIVGAGGAWTVRLKTEDRTAASAKNGAGVVGAASGRCPVEVPVGGLDQPSIGVRAVRAIALRAKAVKRRQRATWVKNFARLGRRHAAGQNQKFVRSMHGL